MAKVKRKLWMRSFSIHIVHRPSTIVNAMRRVCVFANCAVFHSLRMRLENAEKIFKNARNSFGTLLLQPVIHCRAAISFFLLVLAKTILLISSDVCVVYRSLVTHTLPLIQMTECSRKDIMTIHPHPTNCVECVCFRRWLFAISLMHWLQREWRVGGSWTNKNFSKLRISHKYQNTKCFQWAIHGPRQTAWPREMRFDGAEKKK